MSLHLFYFLISKEWLYLAFTSTIISIYNVLTYNSALGLFFTSFTQWLNIERLANKIYYYMSRYFQWLKIDSDEDTSWHGKENIDTLLHILDIFNIKFRLFS